MSHSSGFVVFSDREVLFYEYNGTSDVCMPRLRRTHGEVSDNWRKDQGDAWDGCKCQGLSKAEPCIIHSSYGFGFGWVGKACRACMVITERLSPFDDDLGFAYEGGDGFGEGEKHPVIAMVWNRGRDEPCRLPGAFLPAGDKQLTEESNE